jgi:hypothetical protein
MFPDDSLLTLYCTGIENLRSHHTGKRDSNAVVGVAKPSPENPTNQGRITDRRSKSRYGYHDLADPRCTRPPLFFGPWQRPSQTAQEEGRHPTFGPQSDTTTGVSACTPHRAPILLAFCPARPSAPPPPDKKDNLHPKALSLVSCSPHPYLSRAEPSTCGD